MGCHFSKISIPQYEADEVYSLIRELQPSFHSTVSEPKEFLLNYENLLFLSKGYLNNTVATKKLLASFKLRISGARHMLAIILQALKCYQKQDQQSYSSLTLHKLREFRGAGDPFASLIADEFSSLCKHLQSMVTQLNSKNDEIKRKLSSTKKWKKVWKVLHNAVFISVLALSVILAAMSALSLATAAAVASYTAIKTAEQWIDSIWADRLDALKNEKGVILMMIMKENNVFGVHELESILAMLERLEIRIGSVSDTAGLALANQEEEIALKMAVNDIEPRVGEIGKWIDEVEMKVNACDGEIGKTIAKFLNVIISDL